MESNKNGEVISGDQSSSLFNGIFAYNGEHDIRSYLNKLKEFDLSDIIKRQHWNQVLSNKLLSCVNHIVLGDYKFIKFNPYIHNDELGFHAKYSVYELSIELSFSYFMSSLQEIIVKRNLYDYNIRELPDDFKNFTIH